MNRLSTTQDLDEFSRDAMIGVMTVRELHSEEDPRVVLSGGIVHPMWETSAVVR